MSKQVSISAALSVLAMATFVLWATPDADRSAGSSFAETNAGTKAFASVPDIERQFSVLPLLGG